MAWYDPATWFDDDAPAESYVPTIGADTVDSLSGGGTQISGTPAAVKEPDNGGWITDGINSFFGKGLGDVVIAGIGNKIAGELDLLPDDGGGNIKTVEKHIITTTPPQKTDYSQTLTIAGGAVAAVIVLLVAFKVITDK